MKKSEEDIRNLRLKIKGIEAGYDSISHDPKRNFWREIVSAVQHTFMRSRKSRKNRNC